MSVADVDADTVLGITVALGSLDLTRLETTGEMLAAGLA